MRGSIEFLLGLFDRDEGACVAWEDFEGEHGAVLRLWQRMGLIAKEPGVNPVASCPHCEDGVPYRLGDRLLCNSCLSTVDPRWLLLWQLNLPALLGWVATQWRLRGGVRRIDAQLWQLGTWEGEGGPLECFYQRSGPPSDFGRTRLEAYRNALVVFRQAPAATREGSPARCLCLVEILRVGDTLAVADLPTLLRPRGNVRFDVHSGALWAGDVFLGEVPPGSKEFSFLDCLARHLDHFVAYADLKHYVLHHAGSNDTTEEATFCQVLKNRIKKKYVPAIDRLITKTNKADGFRLRGYVEL